MTKQFWAEHERRKARGDVRSIIIESSLNKQRKVIDGYEQQFVKEELQKKADVQQTAVSIYFKELNEKRMYGRGYNVQKDGTPIVHCFGKPWDDKMKPKAH